MSNANTDLMSNECRECQAAISIFSKSGLCKKCYCRKWKSEHRDRVAITYRKSFAKWKVKNPMHESIYRSNRYKNNEQYRIRHTLRRRLNNALKNTQKMGSAVRDLGCTIEELKLYLESKFQEGMTWENHGLQGWHIDHVVPLSAFDLTDPDQLKRLVTTLTYNPCGRKIT